MVDVGIGLTAYSRSTLWNGRQTMHHLCTVHYLTRTNSRVCTCEMFHLHRVNINVVFLNIYIYDISMNNVCVQCSHRENSLSSCSFALLMKYFLSAISSTRCLFACANVMPLWDCWRIFMRISRGSETPWRIFRTMSVSNPPCERILGDWSH